MPTLARAIYCTFDSTMRDNLAKSAGCSTREMHLLMRAIGAEINKRTADEAGTPVYVQDMIFDMLQEGTLSDSAMLFLVLYGAKELWANYSQGIFLALDAEDEERKEKEADVE
jgi:hypothetical protein